MIKRTALFCALLAAASVWSIAPAFSEEPITVGVIVPVTGALATYGTPFSDAVVIAMDEVNKAGGINGQPVKLLVEDSQASNTIAINALNRILQSKPAAIFGPGLGTQILAMMPTLEKEHLPTLASPSTRRVTQQGAKYLFRTVSHDGVTKDVVTRFIVDDLHKKRVGIMHVANEWGYSGRDNVTAYLDKFYNMKPVSIASYQPTDRDLTAQLLQMKNDGVDVIFSQGHPVDEALLARQLKQLDINITHVGSASLCSAVLRQLVKASDIDGQYCEGPDITPENNTAPEVQAFVKKYKDKTGFAPGIYETTYYDTAHMLADVLKQAGNDREKVASLLRTTSYKGILGTYKSDGEGNLWHTGVVMKFEPDGGVKVVKTGGSSDAAIR